MDVSSELNAFVHSIQITGKTMTSSTASETFPDPKTMPERQRKEVRIARLRLDISKVIPLVAKSLQKEGYGKIRKTEIIFALSGMATARLRDL